MSALPATWRRGEGQDAGHILKGEFSPHLPASFLQENLT